MTPPTIIFPRPSKSVAAIDNHDPSTGEEPGSHRASSPLARSCQCTKSRGFSRALFIHDSRGRDTVALTRIDLGTGETTLIAAHDKAEIGALLDDRETRTPIVYSVISERLEHFALDPSVQPDLDFLASQDIGDWYVSSRTEDDRLWVISTLSDTCPLVEYLFDREAKSLRQLHHAYPELAAAPLVPMRSVTITSRDGLDLVSYVSLPKDSTDKVPQPMVLVVHGGPWARDAFGFNSVHQWLANRGYVVLSPSPM